MTTEGGVSAMTDKMFEETYQRTVAFIAGRFGDKETYRVFGRFLLDALPPVPPLARTDEGAPEAPSRGRSGV